MILLFLLLSCVISTSLMTMFSYTLSRMLNEQFREPELLNLLAIRLNMLSKAFGRNHPLGWIIHYAMGLLFIGIIEWIRFLSQSDVSIRYYLLIGVACGLAGVGIWLFTLKIHPHPPAVAKVFFLQLIFAHIVFGLGAWATVLLW